MFDCFELCLRLDIANAMSNFSEFFHFLFALLFHVAKKSILGLFVFQSLNSNSH